MRFFRKVIPFVSEVIKQYNIDIIYTSTLRNSTIIISMEVEISSKLKLTLATKEPRFDLEISSSGVYVPDY